MNYYIAAQQELSHNKSPILSELQDNKQLQATTQGGMTESMNYYIAAQQELSHNKSPTLSESQDNKQLQATTQGGMTESMNESMNYYTAAQQELLQNTSPTLSGSQDTKQLQTTASSTHSQPLFLDTRNYYEHNAASLAIPVRPRANAIVCTPDVPLDSYNYYLQTQAAIAPTPSTADAAFCTPRTDSSQVESVILESRDYYERTNELLCTKKRKLAHQNSLSERTIEIAHQISPTGSPACSPMAQTKGNIIGKGPKHSSTSGLFDWTHADSAAQTMIV